MARLLLILLLVGCIDTKNAGTVADSTRPCRGIFYERNAQGELKKYNEYTQGGRCVLDNLALSRFERTEENWKKNNVQCVPQPSFPSRTVVAANNYYDTRNGNVFLDFDSSTGIYRRIVLATHTFGHPVYAKLQGCFYVREGQGVDAIHGKQILLDTDVNKIISSQWFDPMEIFRYVEVGNELNMTRFDDVRDYTFMNCPYLRSEWKFCSLLRDGNEMFFPDLTVAQQEDLKNEAILISVQFNYLPSSKALFDETWNTLADTKKESVREDYQYDMVPIPDVPRFIDQAWRDYVMGNRPFMPDVNSNTRPNLCYEGSKTVTLPDGSTGRIRGEICYIDGEYQFTQF